MYQRAYFPMKYIKITQGYEVGSHLVSYALDLSGKDSGAEEVYAPFDCKITKLYQPLDTKKHANTVWLTSTKKVLSPNGYYGYLTIAITHPSEISKMKLGTIYKQGHIICKEGKTGSASGNHIHLEVTKGTAVGWDAITKNKKTYYVNKDKVKPEEYLFVKEDSIILSNEHKGFCGKLIKESDITYKVSNVPSEPLLIHTQANYSKSTILDSKGLKNGDEVIKFYDKNGLSYVYNYGRLGYTSNKYLKKI